MQSGSTEGVDWTILSVAGKSPTDPPTAGTCFAYEFSLPQDPTAPTIPPDDSSLYKGHLPSCTVGVGPAYIVTWGVDPPVDYVWMAGTAPRDATQIQVVHSGETTDVPVVDGTFLWLSHDTAGLPTAVSFPGTDHPSCPIAFENHVLLAQC